MNRLETYLIEISANFIFVIMNVYWCSKLQYERKKLLVICIRGEVICDALC